MTAAKLENALRWLCAVIACCFTLSFIYIGLTCLNYPFPLEWMEGQMIDVIQRVRLGKPLYVEPSIEYVPYIYTPLYFYISAVLSFITGIDFFVARLVSFASALGIGCLLYKMVRKENGDWKAGATAAGLFFATYPLSGRWFDLARVDSLFLFLTLSGLYIFRYYYGWKYAVCAGVIFAAAFFTKQSETLIIAPVFIAGLWLNRRHTLITGGVFAALLAIGISWYDWVSDGWFNFYIFTLPAAHGLVTPTAKDLWTLKLFSSLLILTVVSFASIIWILRKDFKTGLYFTALGIGCIVTSYISRLHSGGYLNVIMPTHIFLALMGGLACAWASQHKHAYVTIPLILCLLISQLAYLTYDPQKLIPSEEITAKNTKFLEWLSTIEGDVFIPDLQFVQSRIGKKSYDYGAAASDILRARLKNRNDVKQNLKEALQKAFRTQEFAGVIVRARGTLPNLRKSYQLGEFSDNHIILVTGLNRAKRSALYRPIPGGKSSDSVYPFDKLDATEDDSFSELLE